MHILFANTGVQIVCVPLRGGSRYQAAQIGYGWQRCRCGAGAESEPPRRYPYVQWQIIQSGTTQAVPGRRYHLRRSRGRLLLLRPAR